MSAEMKNDSLRPALDLDFFREIVGDDKLKKWLIDN